MRVVAEEKAQGKAMIVIVVKTNKPGNLHGNEGVIVKRLDSVEKMVNVAHAYASG